MMIRKLDLSKTKKNVNIELDNAIDNALKDYQNIQNILNSLKKERKIPGLSLAITPSRKYLMNTRNNPNIQNIYNITYNNQCFKAPTMINASRSTKNLNKSFSGNKLSRNVNNYNYISSITHKYTSQIPSNYFVNVEDKAYKDFYSQNKINFENNDFINLKKNEDSILIDVNDDPLQIENTVLSKTNLDYKNYNMLLKEELTNIKFNFMNINPNRSEQKLYAYIESLKSALNSSQFTNITFSNIIEVLKANKKELNFQNKYINSKIEEILKEKENSTQIKHNLNEIAQEYKYKYDMGLEEYKNMEEYVEKMKKEIEFQEIKNVEYEKLLQNMQEIIKKQNKTKIDNNNNCLIKDQEEDKEKIKQLEEDILKIEEEIKDINNKIATEKNELISLTEKEGDLQLELVNAERSINENRNKNFKTLSEIEAINQNSNAIKVIIDHQNEMIESNINAYKIYSEAKNQTQFLNDKINKEDHNLIDKINILIRSLIDLYEKQKQLNELENKN